MKIQTQPIYAYPRLPLYANAEQQSHALPRAEKPVRFQARVLIELPLACLALAVTAGLFISASGKVRESAERLRRDYDIKIAAQKVADKLYTDAQKVQHIQAAFEDAEPQYEKHLTAFHVAQTIEDVTLRKQQLQGIHDKTTFERVQEAVQKALSKLK